MVPSFVNPVATVNVPVPFAPFPCTRSVAPAAFVTLPLKLLVPPTVTAP